MTIEQDKILALEQALLGIKRAGDGLVVLPGLVKIGSLLEVNGVVRADDPVADTDLVTKGYADTYYHSLNRNITNITANYTVLAKDDVVIGTWANLTRTVSLPAATGSGRELTFIANVLGSMLIVPDRTDTINGAASYEVDGGETLNLVDALSGTWEIEAEVKTAYPAAAHASTHISTGSDAIANAVAGGASGLMSGADKTKLDGISGVSGHTIQDEGAGLTARANLNFVGAGVTATDDAGNNATVVTIPGGSGSTPVATLIYMNSTFA